MAVRSSSETISQYHKHAINKNNQMTPVPGVNMIEGERVYGPSSLASSFTTAPRELPAPSNLQGRPVGI